MDWELYLPLDFKLETGRGSWAKGCSLVQIREHESLGWGGGLRIWSTTDTFRIDSHHQENGVWVYKTTNKNIPIIGVRPFIFIIHIKALEDGVFEAWIDGNKVAQDYDDYRMSIDSQIRGHLFRYLQAGLYCGINQPQKEMSIGKACVGSTYEKVKSFLDS